MNRAFVLLQQILPQHLLSRLVAAMARIRISWLKNPLINLFIRIFGVNMEEAVLPVAEDYRSFNDFFTRGLKPSVRSIEGKVSSPVDGTVSMAGRLDGNRILQAKGLDYTLERLMGAADHRPYLSGSFLTAYLSPKDYHRVHVPVTASLMEAHYIPGRLFSVNGATTGLVKDLFAANERLVMGFDTHAGPMAMVMVGAMIVAGIKTVWRPQIYSPRRPVHERFDIPRQFEQGAEIGHFELGSTVIVLFAEELDWLVAPGDAIRMGQPLVT